MQEDIKKPTVTFDSFSVKIEYANQENASNDNIAKVDKTIDKSIEKFETALMNHITLMQILWEYAHEVGAASELTSFSNLAILPNLLEEVTKRKNEANNNEMPIARIIFSFNKKKSDETENKEFEIYEYEHIKKIQDCLTKHDKALKILNETVIQQIVNAWEILLGKLVSWKLQSDPDIIPKDKKIDYSQLLKFDTLDEMKRYFIEKEVNEFLKNKNTAEQISYFKSEFKSDLKSVFSKTNELCEIVLKRHAIVHNGGFASAEYCRLIKRYAKSDLSIGDRIIVDPKYIKNSWSIIYSAGVILTHMVAKQHARSNKSVEEEDLADNLLLNAAFNNLRYEQYVSAIQILEYATSLHLVDPSSQLIALINLAQAYKWCKNEKKCNEILKKHSWESCSSNFRACYYALTDDYEKFKETLRIVAQEKSISIEDLFEWPVFQTVRKKDDFINVIKSAFGKAIVIPKSSAKPKLLHIPMNQSFSEYIKDTIERLNI